jgi:hypothetical protein
MINPRNLVEWWNNISDLEEKDKYDMEIMPNGPGSFRRAGILAVAETTKVR